MNTRILSALAVLSLFTLSSCETDEDHHHHHRHDRDHGASMNTVTTEETVVHERRLAPSTTTETRVYQQ